MLGLSRSHINLQQVEVNDTNKLLKKNVKGVSELKQVTKYLGCITMYVSIRTFHIRSYFNTLLGPGGVN